MTETRGKFITIEGVEGVGKSTQIEAIRAYLESVDIDYVLTREPGGTLFAEKIRNLLLGIQDEDVDPVSELLLIFAARAQHLARLVIPSLEAGKWVLCDRFTDATYAYQGGGRELGPEQVAQLENLVQGSLRPDLTILLDLDPEVGLQRVGSRGELDRFEREEMVFFERVRNAYLDLVSSNPQRYLVIDAGRDVETVRTDLLTQFRERMDISKNG